MLHDPKRRRHRKRSESAQPKFTIQEESFLKIVDELPPIFMRYGVENGKAVVDPDWQGMMHMAATGQLRMVTARYGDILIGFCLNILSRPLMYKTTIFGTTFAVWLDKPYRWGLNGLKLVRRNKELLLEWGCQRLYIAAENPRLGKVYARLGYRFEEAHYVSEADAELRG